MSSKIVLVGKAAAGKDFFRKRMMDKGFNFGVSCTTRLKRIKDKLEKWIKYVKEGWETVK